MALPVSIWSDSTVPANASAADASSVGLGLKFRSSVNGSVTGIRFYKGQANTGTHEGYLWSSTGNLLGSVTFTSETDSGWQQQSLATPIAIQSNTTYIVSYHAPQGGYAADLGYFAASGVATPPLRALAEGEDGSNGVYIYGPGGTFPNQSYNSANYWVDVVVEPDNGPGSDVTPPVLVIPPDVILGCADCNLDPLNTGEATATDDGPVTVTYADRIAGVCPQVVTRIWTATDGAGNSTNAVQTITCLPASVVTDSSGCIFDRDPSTPAQDFRLLFIQDPRNWPCYRIPASNPGQFLYNVVYTGTPGETVSFDLTLPYPFVTQGANPVHAYDWVSVTDECGQPCLKPGSGFYVGSQKVFLPAQPAAGTIPVTLTVPASGVVYLTVHLEYGFKGMTGYTKNVSDGAVDCGTGTLLIPNQYNYQFTVAGAQNASASIQNVNVFKRNPGVAGLVLKTGTSDTVPGAAVALTNPTGLRVGSAVTDQDGFYMLAYKHTGKAATYYLSVAVPAPDNYRERKAVSLKANTFFQVDFWIPKSSP